MEPMWSARLEMLLDVAPDRARAGEVAREWLRTGLDVFGGDLAAAAWTAAPLPDLALRERAPYGKPSQPWADLMVFRSPNQRRAQATALSARNWAAFLDRVSAVPDRAIIRIRTLDHLARPFGWPAVDVRADVQDARSHRGLVQEPVGGEWLQLTAWVPLTWLDDEGYAARCADAWLALADRADPAFGELATGQLGRTELESRLGGTLGLAVRNIPHARQRLRGYGWITICPQELGEALGGPDHFHGSGAFTRVETLAAGGYWLQATPTYRGYDMAAAERVFHVVAPVLIPGRPGPSGEFDPPGRLVLAAPAHQHGRG